MFVTPSDVNGLTGVPGAQFEVLNKVTGERETMGVLFATRMGFMGSDGQSLTNEELIMQVAWLGIIISMYSMTTVVRALV